ncbi:uncharacterized protein LOC127602295 isoform X2 [Hippocampus zosterae]|uniref:uncharacterized protein LOC127602295 isoform X2 n=1 Tax=Hippocampus zosterae TaxID=109293 RepID=UPI00223E5B58|nr:uncharacterized protein LOC127602295 isoform X2 [Hippocampus zosterae]
MLLDRGDVVDERGDVEAEQRLRHRAALFDTGPNREWGSHFALSQDATLHAVVKHPDEGYEFGGAALTFQHFPECCSGHRIKRFGQIIKDGVELPPLLPALLQELPGAKHHVRGSPSWTEARLGLRKNPLSETVSTVEFVALLEYRDEDGVLQFPRHHLLGPALKDEGVEAGLRRSPGESAAPSSSVAQGAAGQDRGSRLLRMSDGSGAP